ANRLPVPCGMTARFLEKGDVDYFVFAVRKGVKYAIVAETYEILSPAEVYLVVKDAKGADLAKSNPQNTPARIDFTAPADGDFFIYAEHLSYLHGPTEVYHLSLREAVPDFDVQLQLDRLALAPGETTVLPVAPPVRRDFTGPIEVTVTGPPGFSGTVTVPNAPPPPPNQPAPPAGPAGGVRAGDVQGGCPEGRLRTASHGQGDDRRQGGDEVGHGHRRGQARAQHPGLPAPGDADVRRRRGDGQAGVRFVGEGGDGRCGPRGPGEGHRLGEGGGGVRRTNRPGPDRAGTKCDCGGQADPEGVE